MGNNWKTLAIGFTLAAALLLVAQHKSAIPEPDVYREVLDLTHPLNDQSPNWEGTEDSPFQAKELGNIEHDGYYSRVFTTQEHYGTHLDAPAHFAKGMWALDQIPPERLVRPLAVLDVRAAAKVNADHEVSMQDVADWEASHGQIPTGAVVMAYTGWDSRWNSQQEFRNVGSDNLLHFPGFALETVKFLVKTRGVVGLGIDTMSVDIGVSTTYPVHQFTSKESVYHLEDVANLAQVPAEGATVVVAPIKLENGSGGPVRVLVLVK
ncbi:MAG: cyclase family protein [Acidobacteriota bacterium]|nr:cyclase family protein [Acidobacteriota bacterium]